MQWVVDTWVLAKCNDTTDTLCLKASELLIRILNREIICLDSEGEITREYYRHIRPRSFVANWWEEMRKRNDKFLFFSNKLASRHRDNLVNKCNFHNDDIKFIGVASKTRDRLLVAEESDYNADVCKYLNDALSVRVLCLTEACSLPTH